MTRMRTVNVKYLCMKHLLIEHRDLHGFAGIIKKKYSLTNHVKRGVLEPLNIVKRHEQIIIEMLRRGYHHYSPLFLPKEIIKKLPESILYASINKEKDQNELFAGSEKCSDRYRDLKRQNENDI